MPDDRDLPLEVKTMPAAAKAIFRAAMRKALKEKPDDLAAILAMRAVKREFTQIENEEGEEEWVSKEEAKKQSEAELAEAMEAIEAEEGEEGEGEEGEEGEGEEGEEGEGSGSSGGGEGDDDDEPVEYSKTSKTTETTETSRALRKKRQEGGEEGEAKDSIQITETFALDAPTVERFGMHITPSGYLVAEPRVSRTGIQIYKGFEVGRPDMDEVRVYRPENEVFDKRAMISLAHRPVTLDHPDTSVDPSNWKRFSVGHSTGDVARDGDFVRVPLALMDAEAIMAVRSGKSQLSVGYGAKLVWGQGKTRDGMMYDAMQTEIRANHIALVSNARGGDKLKMGDVNMDDLFDREFSTKEREKAASKGQAMEGGGFPIKSAGDLRNAIRAIGRAKNPGAAKAHIKKRARALGLTKLLPESWGDSEGNHDQQRRPKMSDRMLTVDGVNIALDDKDGQILERHLKVLNDKLVTNDQDAAALKKKIAELQAELAAITKKSDSKDGEIAVLQKKVEDSKLTDEEVDRRVHERLDVVDRAARYLPEGWTDAKKNLGQIRREVVAAHLGDQRAKDFSDEAIIGAFLSITDEQEGDGFKRMTQSFSRPPADRINDAAAKAYDKRNQDLSTRWMRNKQKASGTA